MKDLPAWFGLKRFPFEKNIKSQDALDTGPFKECLARLDYIKRRGGILLLTGDPGVGKTLALRRYVDSLNDNLFKTYYCRSHQKLPGPHRSGPRLLRLRLVQESPRP
jgi:type II secretory pathway predicted ATPase ExeA